MERLPSIISFIRTRVTPIASANCCWVILNGSKYSYFKIVPGGEGLLFFGNILLFSFPPEADLSSTVNDIGQAQGQKYDLFQNGKLTARNRSLILPNILLYFREAGEDD